MSLNQPPLLDELKLPPHAPLERFKIGSKGVYPATDRIYPNIKISLEGIKPIIHVFPQGLHPFIQSSHPHLSPERQFGHGGRQECTSKLLERVNRPGKFAPIPQFLFRDTHPLLTYLSNSKANLSRSEGLLMLKTLASGTVLLIRPVRTLPGPISTKISTPLPAMNSTDSFQSTGFTS